MEVANEIGISQAQVSRLEKNAIERIKKKCTNNLLFTYINSIIYIGDFNLDKTIVQRFNSAKNFIPPAYSISNLERRFRIFTFLLSKLL